MTTIQKPVPVVNPWAKPFWDAAREDKLVYQHCNQCNKNIFYPRIACPDCFSDDIKWVESKGEGKVYTYTVVENNAPSAFLGDMPYVVAIVRLDEGIQLLSNIVGCEPNDVECEMRVKVTFEKLSDEFTLPKFSIVNGEL